MSESARSAAPKAANIEYPARLISDLHLGHDVSTIASTKQLAPLLKGIRTLILNGDTYEARLPRFQQRSGEMLQELICMAAEQGVSLVFLNGNHDPSDWPHDWMETAEGGVFVTHGHVLLRLVSPWSAKLRYCRAAMEAISGEYSPGDLKRMEIRFELTRRWSEVMTATEVRQAGKGLTAKLAMAMREIWPPSRPWNVAKVWLTLPNVANRFVEDFRPAARVMLFGHTHRAAWWRRNGRLLVNTGGFISFASALAVDFPEEHVVHVRRIRLVADRFVPEERVAEEIIPRGRM